MAIFSDLLASEVSVKVGDFTVGGSLESIFTAGVLAFGLVIGYGYVKKHVFGNKKE